VKIGNIDFENFDWDEGNYLHCQAHGITIEEIEGFFSQELLYFEDKRNSGSEKRWIAVGKAKDKRLMFVAYTIRKLGDERLLRTISARHIHRNSKEEKVYEEIRKKLFERE
jgi:uncharacterized DUF497 family protein